MQIYLKAATNLTTEQLRTVNEVIDHFGTGGVLVVEYTEDSKTGNSVTAVPCVKTGEMLRFTLDRPQSQSGIATLIPYKLSKLLSNDSEGAYSDKEQINSVDNLFEIAKIDAN